MDKPFPAYRGDEPYVFVCYAHEDSGVVYPEIKWLHDQGLKIWYDEGISAGANWRAAIGDALLNCKHFVFYISKSALASDHCNREVNLALDEGKEIIPIYLEEVELSSDLKVGLIRIQALFRDKQSDYQSRLLRVLGLPAEPAVPPQAQPSVAAMSRRSRFPLAAVLLLAIAAVAVWVSSGGPTDTAVDDAEVVGEPSLDRAVSEEPIRLTSRQITRRSMKNPIKRGLLTSDGEYVIARDDDGLWVQAINERDARLFWREADGGPAFAGRGHGSEVYIGYDEGMRLFDAATGQIRDVDIEVVDADGQPVVHFRPSPDKRWAIFRDGNEWWIAPTSLSESDVKPRLLITKRPQTHLEKLAWSPDSEYLAYSVLQTDMPDQESASELIVVNRDGTRRNVVADGSDLWDLNIAEGGAHYAFDWVSSSALAYIHRGATLTLRAQAIVDGAPSGDPVTLYEWPDTWIINVEFEGGRLLYEKRAENDDVWLIELRGEKAFSGLTPVTSDETREFPVGWTESGELLIQVAENWYGKILGTYAIQPGKVDRTLMLQEPLGGIGAHRDGLIGWNEENQLVRVTERNAPEPIYETAGDQEPFGNVACRRDVCVIGLKRGAEVSLHLFDTNTRALGSPFYETRADEISDWEISPDTAEVAILDSFAAQLARGRTTAIVFASTSGSWSKTLEMDGQVDWFDYDTDGQGLYATGHYLRGTRSELVYLTKEGITDTLWSDRKRWIGHPQVSPDGQSLAVTINEIDTDLWMLEGFPDAE